MTRANHARELRQRIGRVLREMRDQGGATLDEVDRITGQSGVRVTRSHLSRVENGEAELSVSRFLSLMGAFGRPVGAAAEELHGVQSGPAAAEPPEALARRANAHLRDGDPAAACRALRAALGTRTAEADPGLVWLWARAEVRLGRFGAAFGATILRLAGAAPPPGLLTAAAVTGLASGRPGVSRALAGLVAEPEPATAALLQAAGALAVGDVRSAVNHLEAMAGSREADPGSEWATAAARLLRAEAYRRGRHLRSAQRLLGEAVEAPKGDPLAAVEWLRLRARIELDRGRRSQASMLTDQALAKARRLGIPDLLRRVQLERADLLAACGRRKDAAAARRAADGLARRNGSDGDVQAAELPLHLLLELVPVSLPH